ASANGKKNNAILLDCKNVEHTYVPLELGDYKLVIANCNKPHNLVESKYNERRQETEDALATLQTVLNVSCLADVTPQQFEENKHLLHGKVRDRAEHVVYECKRVADAVEAMKSGNLVLLGQVLNQSHKSLKEKYEVTGVELDTLAETAQQFPQCLGARMTGAGFGGCTISIVKKDSVAEFEQFVGNAYKAKIGYEASFYDVDIADGIIVEKI
ncbi:MAG: hypothetical protein ACI4QH_01515, partial [Candidatus Fimimonas sp.]